MDNEMRQEHAKWKKYIFEVDEKRSPERNEKRTRSRATKADQQQRRLCVCVDTRIGMCVSACVRARAHVSIKSREEKELQTVWKWKIRTTNERRCAHESSDERTKTERNPTFR